MSSLKKILLSLSLLVMAIGVYFWGEYMQGRANQELERARVEAQREAALLAQVKAAKDLQEAKLLEAKKAAFVINSLNDDYPALKTKYKFPSMHNVRAGIVVDVKSGKVFWGKNLNKSVPIASLTKCLTVLTVLETIRENPKLSLKTEIKLSKTAENTASSSFLERYPDESVTVEELLISAMVKSANDSCRLLAEYFGQGDAEKFIAMMNEKAQQLGLKSSRFSNSHGLPFNREKPELDNHSSIRDLLIVTQKIIRDYPIVFSWTSLRSIAFPTGSPKAVSMNSTNPFLAQQGVNGLKTGFTNNAGWCQILSCKYKQAYFIVMVVGCPNKTTRNNSIAELLYWAKKAL